MNQEKIGKFIMEKRKEKKLTQEKLAESLRVSDRTIGNWENGRNMPDVSLFKPLCDILGITVSELINAGEIDENYTEEKVDETIINAVSYADNKIKQKNNVISLILLIFGYAFIIAALMLFETDSHACSFTIVFGSIISTIGFGRFLTRFKRNLKLPVFILYFVMFMMVLFGLDFLSVKLKDKPPIFAKKITTVNETIYYDTFFYDVVRCNKNKTSETYEIVKNQKYDDVMIINNYCK